MLNWKPERPEMYEDVQTRYEYEHHATKKSPEKRLQRLWRSSRDSARTLVQWDSSENGGFTTSDAPWFYVNPNYKEINLENDKKDPDSVFRFYQKLLQLRKENPAFIEGDLQFYREDSDKLIIYTRSCQEQKMLDESLTRLRYSAGSGSPGMPGTWPTACTTSRSASVSRLLSSHSRLTLR